MSSAENDKPTGRLVWITEEQCDYLLRHPATDVDRAIARAWHRAPADPAEAIQDALAARWPSQMHDFSWSSIEEAGDITLKALGAPNPTKQD